MHFKTCSTFTLQRCLALARAVFAEVAVGDERIKKTHEDRLMTVIQRLYSLVRGKRLAEAETAVTNALYKANQAISAVRSVSYLVSCLHISSFLS